ncbi:unnamed protein product [Adineta ricciae]|uniref:DUF4062 domain-containing protein n=1 Tax=Adineta ricciae TaxID=249248 RepID=A0A814R6C0_ADIRI|nr:unnamed protein product [Adineta ricciae]CAF1463003.1 unnamed protein product [Adineta ricciae]
MSDTPSSRQQQQLPLEFPVQVHPGYSVLPPISSSSSECDKTSSDVKDFWIKLREHINSERLKPYDKHGNQRTSNKVVRIFVSSTFTDFFNEREVLIKKVFTALRDEMRPAGIQIIDCDLRWGVPKDSTTEQTILACLEELDRCLEENGQPFFIGLISDKYGWVPKLNDLPKHITETYSWIDGASITLMEFIHGAFRRNNPNAFFLIRKSEDLLKHLPEKYNDKFRDKDQLSQKQIIELKGQLSEIISPEHIFAYDCSYSGLDSSTGRERVKIDGFEEFEEGAKTFLREAIQKWYPENFNQDNSINIEEKEMNIFLLNKTQYYVDRSSERSMLMKYITGDHSGFVLNQSEKAIGQPLLALTSQPGDGKTMFLAKFVLDIEETMKDKAIIYYYFAEGAYQDGTHFILNNLQMKFLKYLDDNDIKSSKTNEKFNFSDDSFLEDAIAAIPIPIIIIVDGLEKGDLHHDRVYKDTFPFLWFSSLLSNHTYIIISTELNSNLHQTVRNHSHYELELQLLTTEQRSSYIDMFFHSFNKILEPEQKSLLVDNKGGEHPIYLSYVCENLRQFGDYSLVTKRLKKYPTTLDDLLNFLLDEAYEIIDNRAVIDAFFKLLLISDIGLVEADMVNILDHYLNRNTDENNRVDVNPMVWATLRRHVKIFLDTTWIIGSQYIIFRDSSVEKLLRQRCLKADENEIRTLHAFMAMFYRKHSSIKDIATSRVLYHYEQGRMYHELLAYLNSVEGYIVTHHDRQNYLRRRRCTNTLGSVNTNENQRAYACNMCAKRFKLPLFMTQKSPCIICSRHVPPANSTEVPLEKREARLCQKHGTDDYPQSFQCVFCKKLQPMPTGESAGPRKDPLPLFICCECWTAGGETESRCSAFVLDS